MDLRQIRAKLRRESEEEAAALAAEEAHFEQVVRTRVRWAGILGVLTVVTFFSIFPFGRGHRFHAYWGTIGTHLVLVFVLLETAFLIVAMLAYAQWRILRDLKNVNREHSLGAMLARLAERQSQLRSRLRSRNP